MKSAILGCVLAIAPGTVAADRALERGAQALLAEHFEADGPGAVVAIVKDGAPLVVAARGLADIEAGKPLTSASVFDLASVSKHMTAAAILLLAADDELELDAPVMEYVPDFAVPVRGRAITVEDLLRHVSGLADYTSDDYDGSAAALARITTETHLEWLNGTTPRRAPGRKFEYNNSGYALLALIIERVSGATYTEFVTERLFAPAGMRRTQVLDRLHKKIAGGVRGYTTQDGAPEVAYDPSQITGDGNIFSSADDLVKWCGALSGATVLDADALDAMWTAGTLDSGAAIDVEGAGYGYGWWVEEDGVYHDGSWAGTATYIGYDRANGVCVVVLSNDEDADVGAIGTALYELL